MSHTPGKTLSPLAQSAIALDNDFGEMERLGAQLERLNLDSESAFEKAQQLLARFGECSMRIGSGVQSLAAELENSRARAEQAAELVSARAALIQHRNSQNEMLMQQFGGIAEQVRKVTAAVAQLRRPEGLQLSPEDKAELPQQMAQFDAMLSQLVNEAKRIKQAAREASLQTLERNADALEKSMESARRKLGSLVDAVTKTDAEAANGFSQLN